MIYRKCKRCKKTFGFASNNWPSANYCPECIEDMPDYAKRLSINSRLAQKECGRCKKIFEYNPRKCAGVKYCPECRAIPKPQPVIEKRKCAFCGENFEWSSTYPKKKYCSKECCINANKKEIIKSDEKKVGKRNCLTCGKEFYWITESKNQWFCSDECREEHYKPKEIKINKEERKCAYCNKTFMWYSNKASQKYCTTECRQKATKMLGKHPTEENLRSHVYLKVIEIINAGKENGDSFNGKALNYWNLGDIADATRQYVLDRDKNRCVVCGKDSGLHIHHKVKRRDGGDHSPENLVTLCGSCHRAIEIGDTDNAIKVCFRNAKKYYFHVDDFKEKLTLRESIYELDKLLIELSKGSDLDNEQLVKLEDIIESLQTIEEE